MSILCLGTSEDNAVENSPEERIEDSFDEADLSSEDDNGEKFWNSNWFPLIW